MNPVDLARCSKCKATTWILPGLGLPNGWRVIQCADFLDEYLCPNDH